MPHFRYGDHSPNNISFDPVPVQAWQNAIRYLEEEKKKDVSPPSDAREMSSPEPLYLGLDLSTQQLKCLATTSSLSVMHEEIVTFDNDLPHYGTKKGVHTDSVLDEVTAPVAMWIEALDLVLSRMKKAGFEFGRVRGVSGAGQQHGSVFWSKGAEEVLGGLDSGRRLVEQLGGVFTWERSPNWQDHSTQAQCDAFERCVGGEEMLAAITGSKAHHVFIPFLSSSPPF